MRVLVTQRSIGVEWVALLSAKSCQAAVFGRPELKSVLRLAPEKSSPLKTQSPNLSLTPIYKEYDHIRTQLQLDVLNHFSALFSQEAVNRVARLNSCFLPERALRVIYDCVRINYIRSRKLLTGRRKSGERGANPSKIKQSFIPCVLMFPVWCNIRPAEYQSSGDYTRDILNNPVLQPALNVSRTRDQGLKLDSVPVVPFSQPTMTWPPSFVTWERDPLR